MELHLFAVVLIGLCAAMALTSFSPQRGNPNVSVLNYPKTVPVTLTLTTAGGVATLTAAQVLGGLLRINCDDAQTATLPTASLLIAAIYGCEVGSSFECDVINYGDTTLTIALGSGITNFTIGSVKSVLTMATFTAKRFRFVVTSMTINGGTDAIDLYAFGSTAASVA